MVTMMIIIMVNVLYYLLLLTLLALGRSWLVFFRGI